MLRRNVRAIEANLRQTTQREAERDMISGNLVMGAVVASALLSDSDSNSESDAGESTDDLDCPDDGCDGCDG